MAKKIILLITLVLLAVSTVYASAIYDEYNADKKTKPEFTVVFNEEFFYCREDMVITIDSLNETFEPGIIRLELHWQKDCKKEPLIKISDMEVEMREKNIVIFWPTNNSWPDEDGPFGENDDEKFTVKVYYNDAIISQNDEIWIACSKVW